MEAMEQVAATGHASVHAARAAITRPLVAVVAIAALVPAVAAALLAGFARPELSPLLLPVVHRLGGEPALHYPGTLWALPRMLARLGAGAGWLLLPIAAGWTATLAAYARDGAGVVSALEVTLRRLPRWVMAGAPLVLAHDVVVAAQARALAAFAHRPVGALGQLVAWLAADAAVLAVGALVLPLVTDRDLTLRDVPGQARTAWSWHGTGAALFGAAVAAAGFVARLGTEHVARVVTRPHPDTAIAVAAACGAVAALGLVTYVGGSLVLAATLDDQWK